MAGSVIPRAGLAPTRTERPWAVALYWACLTSGALTAGCAPAVGEGPGHRRQALALSPHQEQSLGEQAYREVLGKSRVVPSGPEVERVRELGRRIAKAAEDELGIG
jgi:predicted Zn-dependent protease